MRMTFLCYWYTYICSYTWTFLGKWVNESLIEQVLVLTTSEKKIDSKKEDYKDSLPNHLVRIQIVERVETSIIDSIVFFVP